MGTNIIFIIGCVFPVLGWLTFVSSFINNKISGQNSSAVLIPFIGPILINLWSVQMGYPTWFLIIPWLLDISTISFLIALPKLLSEAWQYSKFTELLTVKSQINNQRVAISLHKNHKFIIRYRWERDKGELGIISTNDFGFYDKECDANYILTSHTGNIITLVKNGSEYTCVDTQKNSDTNINGCVFT